MILFLITSCEENTTFVEVEKNKLLANVVVSSSPSYYDPDSNKVIFKETIDFQGELISERITSIESILIGNENIPFEDSYSIDRKNYGLIKFNKLFNIFIENYNSKKFVINTDIGFLEGTIQIPDSIFNIHYNLSDTITTSDSLIIFFNGNADYYVLDYWITYQLPPDSQFIYHAPGELISKTEKFVLDSSYLNRDGILGINAIESFNGPFLEQGSRGNMTGNGAGFLYSKRRQNIYNYFRVIR